MVTETSNPATPHGFDAASTERLVVSPEAGPVLIEQFRNLAATLNRTQRERTLRSLVVTSPAPGDGKSHVAINLALTLSDSYRRRVMLIDADLRRPTLHRLFRVHTGHGLSEALKGETDDLPAGVKISDRLTLLPAGGPDPSPIGDLASARMVRFLASAVANYDWVIVDAPPAGGLADARIIAETVDAALVVVRAGVTRFPDLEGAAQAVGPERILGIVLNAVDPHQIQREDYYGSYYGYGTKAK
jgi:protein-tyrosine kinase